MRWRSGQVSWECHDRSDTEKKCLAEVYQNQVNNEEEAQKLGRSKAYSNSTRLSAYLLRR